MIAPARRVALEILENIATTDAHSDEQLRTLKVNVLPAQDRNLVTTLVMGTLRWQLALDQIMIPFLAHPERPLSQPVRAALRIGAFQLLHLDRIPPHAVLNESVEWVKLSSDPYAAGMVNAVLRKVLKHKDAHKGAVAAHPSWMVRRWQKFYGAENTLRICEYSQHPAPVILRLVDESTATELDCEGALTAPAEWMSRSRRLLGGDIVGSELLAHGRLHIQDQGSQLVAKLASLAMPTAERVLDACAAPGGKTTVLAERLPKALITAMDVSERRYKQMCRNLSQYSDRIFCILGDAEELPRGARYDLILCDAPCSGTGTIGRNPEIRLRVLPEDLLSQQQRQIRILTSVAKALRPGGRVVYSTCSLEQEENQDVIQAVLEKTSLRLVPIAPMVEELIAENILTPLGAEQVRSAVHEEYLRTLPGVHPVDGFFVAVLERPIDDLDEPDEPENSTESTDATESDALESGVVESGVSASGVSASVPEPGSPTPASVESLAEESTLEESSDSIVQS